MLFVCFQKEATIDSKHIGILLHQMNKRYIRSFVEQIHIARRQYI